MMPIFLEKSFGAGFQPYNLGSSYFLGRCPRLAWRRAFGALIFHSLVYPEK
jgi:hypothetical protein